MAFMNINADIYAQTVATTSVTITLESNDYGKTQAIVYNAGSTDLFLNSGGPAPTAVFPTSPTVSMNGSVIPPGQAQVYTINPQTTSFSLIRLSGSGQAYVQIGYGE